jgi:DNA-binding response OmpR family regulator
VADDYITKPFMRVIARTRSLCRKGDGGASHGAGVVQDIQQFRFDGMTAIPVRLEPPVTVRTGIDQRRFQTDLFLNRPERVLSRDQLMDLIGGWSR